MLFDLSSIGQSLRTARELAGLTLEDVSKALFVRKSLINAIEAGNWEMLPHAVYVKGYVLQYASFLNILDEVSRHFGAEKEKETASREKALPLKTSRVWQINRDAGKIIGGITMALFVIAFLVFQNIQKPVYVAPSVQPVLNDYKTVQASVPENRTEKYVLVDQKKVMITCVERTWVRVLIDGAEKKEFMLNPEEVVVFNAREKFDLLIGNAAGVRVFYQGKDMGFTGEKGEVKRLTLS
jgi:transcriptional regulator with XRE-family HTH domain